MKCVYFLLMCLLAGALSTPDVDLKCKDGCPTTEPPGPTIRCPQCVSDLCTPSMCDIASMLPFPGDCSKFCICETGGAIEMDCAPGTVFDPNTSECVWPGQSSCDPNAPYPGCNAPTTTTRIPNTTTTTLPCETEPTQPVVHCPICVNSHCNDDMCNQALPIPYPGDCSKFCLCDSAGAIEMNCPPGLIWDYEESRCNWPSESSCKNDDLYPGCIIPITSTTTQRPTTTTPPKTTTLPLCTSPGTTLPCTTEPPKPVEKCPDCVNALCTDNMCNQAVAIPYPGDCNKFCLCDSLGSIAFDCPDGLVFNPSINQCDWPQNVSCSNTDPYPGC